MKTVGRYEVVRELGRGAMGVVYEAIDPRLHRLVAVKVLPAAYALEESFRRRFYAEAKSAAQLSHRNIVRVLEADEDAATGQVYIVYELIEGQTLQELLRGQALAPGQAVEIIRQVGEGLRQAHAHGIVHRDVKPSNIFVSKTNRVILSDFGIASVRSASSLTDTGTVLGTPLYMAPEQIDGRPVDARSDIFSLGVVLYEALTRRRPFQGETLLAVMRRTLSETPPAPEEINPEISPALGAVVMKALEKNPANRYASVDQFLEDLARAAEVTAAIPTPLPQPAPDAASTARIPLVRELPPEPIAPTKKRAPRQAWWPPVAAFGVAAVVVFALILLAPRAAEFGGQRVVALAASAGAIAYVLRELFKRYAGSREEVVILRAPPPPPPVASDEAATREVLPLRQSPLPSTQLLRGEGGAVAWLLMLTGPNRGKQIQLKDATWVGRSPDCDVVLEEDAYVSRRHALIERSDARFQIRQAGGRTGVFVNGAPVESQELVDRDEIRVGNSIMLFVQVAGAEDMTADATRRLREFDQVWDKLSGSVGHD